MIARGRESSFGFSSPSVRPAVSADCASTRTSTLCRRRRSSPPNGRREIFFPPFEILRPIPPLAWVPASIIFWPTTELSIAFVTFLGAFFTIVINVLGGARAIDIQYLRAAQSMGASQWDLFRRIILPGTLPSIFTGAAVGMGITWEVVLAAEMISGGGGVAGGGLGFFIWSSYMGGAMEQVIVGMISIGIAGYLSSSLIRYLGTVSMPWRRLF